MSVSDPQVYVLNLVNQKDDYSYLVKILQATLSTPLVIIQAENNGLPPTYTQSMLATKSQRKKSSNLSGKER